MLSLFKKKNLNKTGEDTTVSSEELLNETVDQGSEDEVETKLFYSPAYEPAQELKYVYQFLNLELSPLKPNQISLSGVDLKQDEAEGAVIVTAFVRNSLSKAIQLQEMPLLLLGADGEKLTRKVFDLSVVGEIPAKSSVPWLLTCLWMANFLKLDGSWRSS
jgi:SLAP domain-containing protein